MSFLISEGYAKRTSEFAKNERFDYWRDVVCDEFVQLDCDQLEKSEFDGEVRGGIGVSRLSFSEVLSDPQLVTRSRRQIAKSSNEDFLISFQLAKNGVVRQSGREALLTPGSFALYDSTEPYTLAFKERFHQFVIQMPKDVLSRHLMNPEQYTAIAISGKTGLGSVLTNFILSLVKELHNINQAPEELSDNLVNMIAMAFSSSVMLEQVGDQSYVRESLKTRIRHYIDNNLCDADLSNTVIADSQGISVRYLHKLFQDEEETIHALILSKRLEKAHALLSDSAYAGYNIERIAFSTGFASSAHFSRSFKKYYGCNPSEIRA